MNMFEISHAELAMIQQRISTLRAEDTQATQELADSTNNGAETWHDNAAFDAAKDKKNLATISLAKLESLQSLAKLIDVPDRPKQASVGTRVHYRDEDTGLEHEICLAGDAAWLMGDGWASVKAPLGMALHGAKVGTTVTFNLPSGSRDLTILELEPA